jgi:hypothetical protein
MCSCFQFWRQHESSLYGNQLFCVWIGQHRQQPVFLRVSLDWIKTPFLYGLEPMPRSDRCAVMEDKILAAAALLLERHGQKAPDVALHWATELTKRQDAETAEVCLHVADAASKLLIASGAKEPTLADVLSGVVTGQMMRADRVERRDVEKLMKNAKSRRRAKRRSRPDHAA